MKYELDEELLTSYIIASRLGEDADAYVNDFFLPLSETDCEALLEAYRKGEDIPSKLFKLAFESSCEEYDFSEAPFLHGYGLEETRVIDPKIYQENPYYKLLNDLASRDEKSIHFGLDAIYAFRPFVLKEKSVKKEEKFADISPLAVFIDDFVFPTLQKDGRTWMSLVPHEIETMKKPIEEAEGNVLTLGLGLGYYAFMCAEKEEVESVTIAEMDEDVIRLFNEHLLPHFPHKEKIHIVKGDALAYTEKHQDEFDYIFADIWHNVEDALPSYLLLKRMEKKPFAYWIEEDILVYLRRHLVALMEEEFFSEYGDEEYEASLSSDDILARMHFYLKDKVLSSEDDLIALLSEDSLKEIAKLI